MESEIGFSLFFMRSAIAVSISFIMHLCVKDMYVFIICTDSGELRHLLGPLFRMHFVGPFYEKGNVSR